MHKISEHLWCECEAISSIPEILKFQSSGLMLRVLCYLSSHQKAGVNPLSH
jgi:hypothetical protein